MRQLFFILFFVFIHQFLAGQKGVFTQEDFVPSGDAFHMNQQCFQLTDDVTWQRGAVWFRSAIHLGSPFQMEMDLFFGCHDRPGADGIVFIFHPEITTGYAGEGMGFGRLSPSFGIEMDTYENYHLEDPPYDHVAFMQHGLPHHYYGVTAPSPLTPNQENVEDCKNHRVKLKWDSDKKVIQFYFDGSLRLEKKVDLVNQIFDGDPVVYWGFSAATGGSANEHRVCFKKLEFKRVTKLEPATEEKILSGEKYTFKNLDFGSGSYTISQKAKEEIDLIIPILKKDRKRSIFIAGFTDSSGNANRNQDLSTKRAKAIAEYIEQKGIPSDRIQYQGYGPNFPIAPNDTEDGRRLNRRVEINLFVDKV